MNKLLVYIIGVTVTIGLLSSCQDDNNWNLNSIPSIILDSINVTTEDSSYTLKKGFDSVFYDPNSNVKLNFTASSQNVLEQISFHDGTQENNMTLVHNSEVVNATAPNSKYRISGDKKNISFSINFASLSNETIFSMFVIDKHGMSKDFELILNSKSIPTIVVDSIMTKKIVGTDTTISWYKEDTLKTMVNGVQKKVTALKASEITTLTSTLTVEANSDIKLYCSTRSNFAIETITYSSGTATISLDKKAIANAPKTYNLLKNQVKKQLILFEYTNVIANDILSVSMIDDNQVINNFKYKVNINTK